MLEDAPVDSEQARVVRVPGRVETDRRKGNPVATLGTKVGRGVDRVPRVRRRTRGRHHRRHQGRGRRRVGRRAHALDDRKVGGQVEVCEDDEVEQTGHLVQDAIVVDVVGPAAGRVVLDAVVELFLEVDEREVVRLRAAARVLPLDVLVDETDLKVETETDHAGLARDGPELGRAGDAVGRSVRIVLVAALACAAGTAVLFGILRPSASPVLQQAELRERLVLAPLARDLPPEPARAALSLLVAQLASPVAEVLLGLSIRQVLTGPAERRPLHHLVVVDDDVGVAGRGQRLDERDGEHERLERGQLGLVRLRPREREVHVGADEVVVGDDEVLEIHVRRRGGRDAGRPRGERRRV